MPAHIPHSRHTQAACRQIERSGVPVSGARSSDHAGQSDSELYPQMCRPLEASGTQWRGTGSTIRPHSARQPRATSRNYRQPRQAAFRDDLRCTVAMADAWAVPPSGLSSGKSKAVLHHSPRSSDQETPQDSRGHTAPMPLQEFHPLMQRHGYKPPPWASDPVAAAVCGVRTESQGVETRLDQMVCGRPAARHTLLPHSACVDVSYACRVC